ncbi:hypothetical protein AB0346_04815 [Nocardia beijingensis]|uniref:5-methylcytosine restriction system specificity protein McrC n=1 Tax=Nocardia beijingensis TaxID=95162 RepID=UPI00344DC915
MAQRILFRENIPVRVTDATTRDAIIRAAQTLRKDLRPTIPPLITEGDEVIFQNFVGSLRLPDGSIAEVTPKIGGEDWANAVVQLLQPDTRITIAGSQRSQPSASKNALTTALALEYARRLESALRSEGPLLAYERQRLSTRRLRGHLNVTRWVRTTVLDPATFPVTRDELTSINDFTRGLSLVSGLLGRASVGADLALRLRRLQTAILPGHPPPSYVNPAISQRPMPTQWAKYRPAWDIAAALLRSRSVVGDPGRAIGFEVGIEPWRLLENLLKRTLRQFELEPGEYKFARKSKHPLLWRDGTQALGVEPDGILYHHGRPAATFECKYTPFSKTPKERHVHQALTAAAALGSPLAVLIYPEDVAPIRYTVHSFNGKPIDLFVIGMSMYSYKRGQGDSQRANLVRNIMMISQKEPPS